MPNFEALQTFVAVAECGGLVEAGRRLAVSKSLVSRRLAALEAELGAPLLHRHPRAMALTPAGERFLLRCRQVLRDLEQACDDVAGDTAGEVGLVRLTVPSTLGEALVAPVLAALLPRYPRLSFEVIVDERKVDLVASGIDVAIRTGPLADSNLLARRLATVRSRLLASPAYLQRRGRPASAHDLLAHDVLGHVQTGAADVLHLDGTGEAQGDLPLVPAGRRVRVNDFGTLLDLARRGAGITALPLFLGRAEVARGDLVAVLPELSLRPLDLHVVSPRLSARARLLVDALVTYAERPVADWGA